MLKMTSIFLFFFVASRLHAEEVKVDLGIVFAPSVAPELGYSEIKMRTGIELGISIWNFSNEDLLKIKNVGSKSKPSLKIARLGLSYIDNNYGIAFTPIAVNVQDKLYIAPSFIFGEKPYQTISISYEIW